MEQSFNSGTSIASNDAEQSNKIDLYLYQENGRSKFCHCCKERLREKNKIHYINVECAHKICRNCTGTANEGHCEVCGIKTVYLSVGCLEESIAFAETLYVSKKKMLDQEQELRVMRRNESCYKDEKKRFEEEIASLKKNSKSNESRAEPAEKVDTICMECGYSVIFERSRICVPCGIRDNYLMKISLCGQDRFVITSYEKAEDNLLCGACILEGEHESHQTLNYFKLKIARMASLNISNTINRMKNSFDEGWTAVCKKIETCHRPIFEVLDKCEQKSKEMNTWSDFIKAQNRFNYTIDRIIETKAKMIRDMHKYSRDMQLCLTDVRIMSGRTIEEDKTIETSKVLQEEEVDMDADDISVPEKRSRMDDEVEVKERGDDGNSATS